jgi:hypothetical protein
MTPDGILQISDLIDCSAGTFGSQLLSKTLTPKLALNLLLEIFDLFDV